MDKLPSESGPLGFALVQELLELLIKNSIITADQRKALFEAVIERYGKDPHTASKVAVQFAKEILKNL